MFTPTPFICFFCHSNTRLKLASFRLCFSDYKIFLRLTCGGACASHVNPTVLLMIWQHYHQTSTHSYVLFNFQLNMSIVYRVVQFSFLHARFVAIPFLDTGTKFAYTIMKVVLINHISKVKVSPHVRPHFPTMVTASLTRMHEVQRLISTGLRDIHNWIRDERII